MEKKYKREPGVDGKPYSLNEQELKSLKEYLDRLIYNPAFHIYPTFPEITDLVFSQCNKRMSLDILRHLFYNKFPDDYKTCIGKLMDLNRIEVNLSVIGANFFELSQKVYGVPAQFVFNVDEMGQADYADSHETIILVLKSYNLPTAVYPIDRQSKRSTCLACITPN